MCDQYAGYRNWATQRMHSHILDEGLLSGIFEDMCSIRVALGMDGERVMQEVAVQIKEYYVAHTYSLDPLLKDLVLFTLGTVDWHRIAEHILDA